MAGQIRDAAREVLEFALDLGCCRSDRIDIKRQNVGIFGSHVIILFVAVAPSEAPPPAAPPEFIRDTLTEIDQDRPRWIKGLHFARPTNYIQSWNAASMQKPEQDWLC